jgi:hypothetical protein
VNSSDAYRDNAEGCAKLAQLVRDPISRLALLKMAETWLRLADYAGRLQQEETRDSFVEPNR